MNFVEIIQKRDSEKSRQISTKLRVPICLFWKLADWYPSLVDSGTLWSTRAHQARVPSWATKYRMWPTKLLILFFFFDWALLNCFFLILFFYLYNVLLFETHVCFFFFHSGPAMLKTFFINSLFFIFNFFYLYNM